MTSMLHCSDAWSKRHFKPQYGPGELFLKARPDLVDKNAVQTRSPIGHAIIHWRVGRRARYALRRKSMRSSVVFRILSIVFSGLFVGLAARYLYPGPVPMGLGRTILLGIAGSLVAGLAASWGREGRDGISRAGCLASVVGALVLIFIGRHL